MKRAVGHNIAETRSQLGPIEIKSGPIISYAKSTIVSLGAQRITVKAPKTVPDLLLRNRQFVD